MAKSKGMSWPGSKAGSAGSSELAHAASVAETEPVSFDPALNSPPAVTASWQEFEQLAAAAMHRLGFVDAAVTGRGVDGGVDVRAREALAQVKNRLTATPRPEIQQLHGVARSENRLGLFFSSSGYTAGAIEWAEEAGVALFVLESSGAVRPIGTTATSLAENAAGLAAGTPNLGQGLESAMTFGSMLASGDLENIFVHLPAGEKAALQGRVLAELVASSVARPLRIIDASALGSGGGVPVKLMQHVVPGEVVYLDRIELFPEGALRLLLYAFSSHLKLTRNDKALGDHVAAFPLHAHQSVDMAPSADKNDDCVSQTLLAARAGARQVPVMAKELQANLSRASGPGLRRPGDVAGLLTSIGPGSVLFIDEIHHLSAAAAALLCEALEDGEISVAIGRGSRARTVALPLPPFVCVGATTDPEALSPALRSAFASPSHVEDPAKDPGTLQAALAGVLRRSELANAAAAAATERHQIAAEQMVRGVWDRAAFEYDVDALRIVAQRAGPSRRHAFHLAHRVLSHGSEEDGPLGAERASKLAEMLEIDDSGFTEADWLLLDWAVGAADMSHGSIGTLPPVTVIASTSVAWDRRRDVSTAKLRSSLVAN